MAKKSKDPTQPIYPGPLGKFVPLLEHEARWAKAQKTGDFAGIDKWEDKRFAEATRLLFRHFEIDPDEPTAWMRLSVALIQKHVPMVQVEAAPIRKERKNAKKRKRKGRPTKYRESDLMGLIVNVEHYVKKHGLTGRDAEKRAIEAMLRANARRKGKSETVAAEETTNIMKRLSDARSRFRK